MLKVWNVSLVLATGVLAILGTFLVRSGILESIHAFGASTLGELANDGAGVGGVERGCLVRQVFDVVIKDSVRVKESPAAGLSIFDYDHGHDVARADADANYYRCHCDCCFHS